MSTNPVVPTESKPQPASNLSTRHDAVYRSLEEPVQPIVVTPVVQTQSITIPTDETKPPENLPQPEAKPAEPKLFAGKYKSVEELEKGYTESQRLMHESTQERSELQQQLQSVMQYVDVDRFTKAQAQTEVKQAVENKDALLDMLVSNPDQFEAEITNRVAARVSRATELYNIQSKWRLDNPDLVPVEHLVTAELQRLAISEPALLNDVPSAIAKATENYRGYVNAMRASGRQEVTQVISEVKGTSLASVPQSGERAPITAPAPEAAVDPFDEYISSRKREVSRGAFGYAAGGVGPLKVPIGRQ